MRDEKGEQVRERRVEERKEEKGGRPKYRDERGERGESGREWKRGPGDSSWTTKEDIWE